MVKTETVQAVERASRILQTVASAATSSCTVAEVAIAAGLNRTVVHRTLRTLADVGLVREESGRYSVGEAMLGLGCAYLERLHFRRPALHHAMDLRSNVIHERPWLVTITAPLDHAVAVIDRIWGETTPLNSILDVGQMLPYADTAAGRVLLAHMTETNARRRVGDQVYEQLLPVLQQVRARGYEIAEGEYRAGLWAVAAAIVDGSGTPVGSIAIAGPNEDPQPDFAHISGHVIRAAAATGRWLTHPQ